MNLRRKLTEIRWQIWNRFGYIRCPYCVRMSKCEWSLICDCFQAPFHTDGSCGKKCILNDPDGLYDIDDLDIDDEPLEF